MEETKNLKIWVTYINFLILRLFIKLYEKTKVKKWKIKYDMILDLELKTEGTIRETKRWVDEIDIKVLKIVKNMFWDFYNKNRKLEKDNCKEFFELTKVLQKDLDSKKLIMW